MLYPLSSETFTAAMFQVQVFCIVTPCSVVVGNPRFKRLCCLLLQGKVAVVQSLYEEPTLKRGAAPTAKLRTLHYSAIFYSKLHKLRCWYMN
jgi:hypothetical protein